MYNFTAANINFNYMFQLHKVAIIRVDTSEVQKGNYISVFYIQLKVVSGQDLSITYKGVHDSYTYMC
jgi:hypothetical protein